jgi:electron transfer DM13
VGMRRSRPGTRFVTAVTPRQAMRRSGMSPTSTVPAAARRWVRLTGPLLAIPSVAAVVVAGVWVAGGVISDDFRTSMALTAVWFGVSGAACLAVALRSRRLRLPTLGAYVVTVAVVGGYLGLSTLRDRVVHERVVTAGPAADAPAASRANGSTAARNVEVAGGQFRSHEHETSGAVRVVRLADGRRFLTLTNFVTSAGPDLRIRLVPGDSFDGGASGAVDLGALKGNRGDQQYDLPRHLAVAGRTVVIWCRAFSAPFGSAPLRTV